MIYCNNKHFQSIDDQIQNLKNKHLKINDVNKLKNYLKKYSYQTIIDGYNKCYLCVINNKRYYKETINSDVHMEINCGHFAINYKQFDNLLVTFNLASFDFACCCNK